jgi:hypothetical protein
VSDQQLKPLRLQDDFHSYRHDSATFFFFFPSETMIFPIQLKITALLAERQRKMSAMIGSK